MSTAASRAIFVSKEDSTRLLGEGEMISNPAYADTLEVLAIEGEDLFYRGEIAARISADCQAGGALTRADLEGYRIEHRSPLNLEYCGAGLFTNPPPSTGGILIAFALQLLKECSIGSFRFGTAAHRQRLVQIIELTNLARVESRLHQASDDETAETLLDSGFLEVYRVKVLDGPKASRGTTHISIIDDDGNAAALTLSNGEGAGYIIPETGIMLNYMLGEEDINPHGFHAWPMDVRMCSMMAPTLVVEPEGCFIALGSGGSNRIRTALVQVLSNFLDFEMPIGNAIASPRVHFEGNLLNIEIGFDAG